MALNTNYGYAPSGYSSPYSSTPTGIRAQRPRFGYSGPSMYSRFRSPSDTNTQSFSDSMVNNYGTSTSRIDTTFNSEDRSLYNDSYNSSGSAYYSANDSFSHMQSYGETSMMRNDFNLSRGDAGLMRDNSMMYKNQNMMRGYSNNYSGVRAFPHTDTMNSGILPKAASQFDASKYNSSFGMNNVGEFKGSFQKKSVFGAKNKKPYSKKTGKFPKMAVTKQSGWRCELCSLEFTSQIPYEMHFRGAKHAKKIKANQALAAVKSQANNMTVTGQDDKKSFFCELCNVKANSSLQLQTHLEGTKHKSKIQSKEAPSSQPLTQEDSKDSAGTPINGKTNGSLVRTLPADFGEPQPSKLVKYACEVCNVSVNSEIQLQQHLTSKKHQNKLEGRPTIKGKRVKKDNDTTQATDAAGVTSNEQSSDKQMSTDQTSNETSTKVVGVKTLASSFVQGETLH